MKPSLKTSPVLDENALLLAFFGALCLFFSTLEYLIPKPVPFFRLGLANLPILLAFPLFKGRDIVLLTVLKVLGQALVNGTLASYVFLFSLAGSVASVLTMFLAWKACGRWVSAIGLSLLGALASNTVQIMLSIYFIFGTSAWIIAPLFMGLGLAAGLVVGMAAIVFANNSSWYKNLLSIRSGLDFPEVPPVRESFSLKNDATPRRKQRWRLPPSWDVLGRTASSSVLFWLGIAILPAYLFQENLTVRCVQVGGFALLAVLAGKRLSPLYFLAMILSVTLFNLFVPSGKVLFSLFGFLITEQALLSGLYKGIGIVGLVLISLSTVRPDLHLPGRLGGLLGQLFRYYEEILSIRSGFDARHPIASIDRILFSLAGHSETTVTHENGHGTTFAGWIIVSGLLISQWGLLFVKF